MKTPLIVSGPQGCGKSRLAQEIAQHFKCSRVVDGWDGLSPVPEPGDLLLTQVPVEDSHVTGCRVMVFEEVQAALIAARQS